MYIFNICISVNDAYSIYVKGAMHIFNIYISVNDAYSIYVKGVMHIFSIYISVNDAYKGKMELYKYDILNALLTCGLLTMTHYRHYGHVLYL